MHYDTTITNNQLNAHLI